MVGSMLDFPKPVAILMVVASAMLVSALYAGFVGLLKAHLGIHEVISGIMLNWIALYFSNWICGLDFFHKPGTVGMYPVNPCTYTIILPEWKRSEAGQAFLAQYPLLKETVGRTDVNIGFIAAVIAAFMINHLLNRTRKGYELRAVGQNIHAARFAGINVKSSVVHAMMISGALCGLGAAFYITGQSPHTVSTLSALSVSTASRSHLLLSVLRSAVCSPDSFSAVFCTAARDFSPKSALPPRSSISSSASLYSSVLCLI